jgi:predicted metal-dependent RNase
MSAGYCVAGTIGHKILNGTRKIEFKKGKPLVEVKMSVQYMSFSAHADAKGIMQLISYCEPRHVMLVHGKSSDGFKKGFKNLSNSPYATLRSAFSWKKFVK